MAQRTETYTCRACNAEVIRPIARGQRPKWCDRCRYKTRERPCAGCGKVTPMVTKVKYCGPACIPRYQGKQLVLVGKRMRQPAVIPASRMWASGPCGWCLTPFVGSARSRYCRPACSTAATDHRRRELRGEFSVTPGTRMAIYQRDALTCQLCYKPVDLTLPSNDRWSATLDHIECQSWTLIPDHSPSNLRLAHRMCNSIRGADLVA